jgi:hypothetical protein
LKEQFLDTSLVPFEMRLSVDWILPLVYPPPCSVSNYI